MRLLAVLRVGLAGAAVAASLATTPMVQARATPEPLAEASRGRPRVKLDRLELPPGMPHGKSLEKQLRRTLRREVRRVDWGAGRGSTIYYRFKVTEMKLDFLGGALRVTCTATGRLPRGKRARSHLAFSGDPRKPKAVMARVLEIVARGVVGRLAQLERRRRGADE